MNVHHCGPDDVEEEDDEDDEDDLDHEYNSEDDE